MAISKKSLDLESMKQSFDIPHVAQIFYLRDGKLRFSTFAILYRFKMKYEPVPDYPIYIVSKTLTRNPYFFIFTQPEREFLVRKKCIDTKSNTVIREIRR